MVFPFAYVSKVGDLPNMILVVVICNYWWRGVMIHFLNVRMLLLPEGWRGVLQVEGCHVNWVLRFLGHVTRLHSVHHRVLSTEWWSSILGMLICRVVRSGAHVEKALLFIHLFRRSFLQVSVSEAVSCLLGDLGDVGLSHWVLISAG